MGPVLALLILASVEAAQPVGASYQTAKSVPDLQKCLTDKLTGVGDVTALKMEGYVTLMLRGNQGKPMLIDLAPPKVTVTTDFLHGTRKLVEACV